MTADSATDRFERALASLRGLSVGDALGSQFFVPANYPLLKSRDLPPDGWQWTDDTEMACSVLAVLASHERVDQDALAHSFARHHDFDRGYGPAVNRLLSFFNSVASNALASPSSAVTPRARRPGSPGRASIARSITCAFAVESHPSANASPTGASSGRSTAFASRTIAGPVPLCPPATAVTKSAVDAHPTAFTAEVASSSATMASSTESRVDFNASTATTVSIRSPPLRAAHSV